MKKQGQISAFFNAKNKSTGIGLSIESDDIEKDILGFELFSKVCTPANVTEYKNILNTLKNPSSINNITQHYIMAIIFTLTKHGHLKEDEYNGISIMVNENRVVLAFATYSDYLYYVKNKKY